MAREQLVRVFPARLGPDAREPAPYAWVVVPVDPQLVFEEKVGTRRKVGDGKALADKILVRAQLRVEDLPRCLGALAEFLGHRFLGSIAHPGSARRNR